MIRTGTISVHPRGFGFLGLDQDKAARSAFITPPDLNPFLAGDHVQARVTEAADGRLSAADLQLLERSRRTLFGQVVSHRGQPHLRVDRSVSNTDWRLAASAQQQVPAEGKYAIGRVEGDHVVCERVLEEAADVAFEQVLERYELRRDFPEPIATPPAQAAPPRPDSARRDLRELPFVTIDAASTRDLDDAVTALPADAEGAMRILVSIADVSWAVGEGTGLDEEARRRGTSVYLPDRVLPMLPRGLSEESSSLIEGADRDCITVELRIDAEGVVRSTDIYRSVIRSHARLTYDEVAAFLERGESSAKIEPLRSVLSWCRTASARLSQARASRGGVEFEADEMHIVVDANTRRTTVVEPLRNTTAHMLIERFMVAANEAVAIWLAARGVPSPFRVHDEPGAEAVQQLQSIAHNFGFEAGFGPRLTPVALGALERQIHSAPAAPAILSVLAGALGPARYTVQRRPHFGLGAPLYLHFTSPIRRYADLLVHRGVASYLDGARPQDPDPPALQQQCDAINVRARQAERAERDCRRVAAARYMAGHIGERFEANIVAVRPFGLQVQLTSTLIVGTVPNESLRGGPYHVSESTRELVSAGGVRYAIGMPLRVRASHVDEMLGRVEFDLS